MGHVIIRFAPENQQFSVQTLLSHEYMEQQNPELPLQDRPSRQRGEREGESTHQSQYITVSSITSEWTVHVPGLLFQSFLC